MNLLSSMTMLLTALGLSFPFGYWMAYLFKDSDRTDLKNKDKGIFRQQGWQQYALSLITFNLVSFQGALYQAKRVAYARNVDIKIINNLIKEISTKSKVFGSKSLINVLELNLIIDKQIPLSCEDMNYNS